MAIDIYEIIEKNVMNQLENGLIPWRMCYKISGASMAFSHSTGKVYSLLNQFLLNCPGEYWTFNQARNAGYSVRKGSKACKVVFWKVFSKEDGSTTLPDGSNAVSFRTIPFLKWYNVFHESDIEGLPRKPLEGISEEDRERKNSETIEKADAVIRDYMTANQELGLVTATGKVPCYNTITNTIFIPEKCQFDNLKEYYAAVFHEMVHSTLKPLSRTSCYEREELVAEIGAAFLCGYCGIEEEDIIQNHSAYCAGWLKRLKGKVKDLVVACGKAEQAVKYILGERAKEIFGDEQNAMDGEKENE